MPKNFSKRIQFHRKNVSSCITDNQFLANYLCELVGHVVRNYFFKVGLLENNFLKENIRDSVRLEPILYRKNILDFDF